MAVFIILGVLVLGLCSWLVIKDQKGRRSGDQLGHDVSDAASRARADVDRHGHVNPGDGMNAGG